MSEHYNQIAANFLTGRGFTCDLDLSWLGPGLRPDVFCHGPSDLWVEVKTRTGLADDDHLFRIFEYLRTKADPNIGTGRGYAQVAKTATTQDAKAVLALARQALQSPEAEAANEICIILPDDPDGSSIVHFMVAIESGRVLFVCRKSNSGSYGYPLGLEPNPFIQDVLLNDEAVADRTVPFHEIATEGAFRLALRIFPDGKPFHIGGAGPAEGARRVRTEERIRAAIKTANKQLKRALSVREAPAVVFIYHDDLFVANDALLLSALFGDRQYVFDPNDFHNGYFCFGPNGAWTSGQHKSVSAVTYFANEGPPLTVHNPWALRPLEPGLLGNREYVPQSDGTLTLIERA
ncbi:MAG: hypothetical protein ACOY3L_14385 [Pseudomonadota bacterium]